MRTASVARMARYAGFAGSALGTIGDYQRYEEGEISGAHLGVNSSVGAATILWPRLFGPYGFAYSIQDPYNRQVGGYMYEFAMWISPNIEIPLTSSPPPTF